MSDQDQKSSQMRGVICFLEPKAYEGKEIKLTAQQTLFGREKGDIKIPDLSISSTHCQIQVISDKYILYDMNSSNGTYINNQKILKQELCDGDHISIGTSSFTFHLRPLIQTSQIPSAAQFAGFEAGAQEGTRVVDVLFGSQRAKAQSWSIQLEACYSDGQSEQYVIDQNSIVLGRSCSYGRFDKESTISRSHLLVKVNEYGEIFVEDQNSTNGSFINGEKISGIHPVTPKDQITIGALILQIIAVHRK